MIDLESRRIVPCTPRKFNEKISKSLRKFYRKARRSLEEKKFLFTVTLEGLLLVFVEDWTRYLSRRVLALQIHDGGFKAYEGYVAMSKIYSAFAGRNAWIIMKQLIREGREIEGVEELLLKLEEFDVDLNALPECAVSKIALAKLLEG